MTKHENIPKQSKTSLQQSLFHMFMFCLGTWDLVDDQELENFVSTLASGSKLLEHHAGRHWSKIMAVPWHLWDFFCRSLCTEKWMDMDGIALIDYMIIIINYDYIILALRYQETFWLCPLPIVDHFVGPHPALILVADVSFCRFLFQLPSLTQVSCNVAQKCIQSNGQPRRKHPLLFHCGGNPNICFRLLLY